MKTTGVSDLDPLHELWWIADEHMDWALLVECRLGYTRPLAVLGCHWRMADAIEYWQRSIGVEKMIEAVAVSAAGHSGRRHQRCCPTEKKIQQRQFVVVGRRIRVVAHRVFS